MVIVVMLNQQTFRPGESTGPRRGNLGKGAPWPRLIIISHPNNQVGAREGWYAEGKYPLESLDLLKC
jgi:hypothetical protein